MKILLLTIFIFISFASVANAQLCGKYTTTFIVTDRRGVPIKNAGIKAVPLRDEDLIKSRRFVWERDDFAKISISFPEGYKVSGVYKIMISAKGYLPEEKEISFPHCRKQKFEFKLKAENAEKQTTLSGRVLDQSGAIIPETKVVLTSATGEKFEIYTNDQGIYEIDLSPGTFSIEFEYPKHEGWEKYKIEKYEIPLIEKITLDATLRVNKDFYTNEAPVNGASNKNNN